MHLKMRLDLSSFLFCCLIALFHALYKHNHLYTVRQHAVIVQWAEGRGFDGRSRGMHDAPIVDGRIRKSQVATTCYNSSCICGSGMIYQDCCKVFHDRMTDPVQLTRARYAAYALGLPDYIIQTCHPTNRDYARHFSSNKDSVKAFKSWRKEIVTKNSEVFEFLKLELLNSTESADATTIDKHNNDSSTDSVLYNVIAREKSTSKVIAFQERAVYIRDSASTHRLRSNSVQSSRRDAPTHMRWFYSKGTITPMEEEKLTAQLSTLPKYSVQDTIRDRW